MEKKALNIKLAAASAVAAVALAGLACGFVPQAVTSAEAATSTSASAAKDADSKDSKDAKVSTADVESQPFSMDVDCSVCHKKAVKKMEKEGYTGALHAQLDCGMCHNEKDLTEVHEKTEKYTAKKGDKVVALTKTAINEEACYACHGTLEELAETTKDSEVLVDENGLAVNPHDLPADHYGSKVVCGSCHKMHDTKEIEVSAVNACLGCHHDNVYECGTCHAV